jgi:DNA-binding SARP family transcriptional activator
MDVQLLGPLAARLAGKSVVPEAAKPRKVLALLALRAGQVVPVPVLLEELWEECPPSSAMTTLQTYVLQLRRMIAAARPELPVGAAKDVLCTRFGGYLLQLGSGTSDVAEFTHRGAMGEHALALGDPETASRLLREALRTWRGAALVDVEIGPRIGADLQFLAEQRLTMLEQRVDADLQLGRHAELLGELAALTSEHKLNERLCEQRMVALCRSGRRSDALIAYNKLRKDLAGELGLEPGKRLRRLQLSVLNSDPSLDVRPGRRPQLILG